MVDGALDGDDELLTPWKARLLLMLGGMFGAHRLYLRQMPEAFIFFSTAGVFLLGIIYDSLYLNAEVHAYNDAILERKEGRDEDSDGLSAEFKNRKGSWTSARKRVVRFSFTRFFYSVLFGAWLGFLAWLACTVTIGWTRLDHVPLIAAVAAAISAGVYVVGQCGGESRELLYIWMSAFSTAFLLAKLLAMGTLHTILLTAVAATFIGNRTAKFRGPQRRFSGRKFLFWCSLFGLLMCVIALGCTRKIMDRKVTASHPGKSSLKSSIGRLLYDRLFDPRQVYTFFKDSPNIEYQSYSTDSTHAVSDPDEMGTPNKAKPRQADSSFWRHAWKGVAWDEWMMATTRPADWIERAAVLVVDVLRAETMVLQKQMRDDVEPLQWAAWRLLLLQKFDLPPFADDERVQLECQLWLRRHKGREVAEHQNRDFASIAARKACGIFV